MGLRSNTFREDWKERHALWDSHCRHLKDLKRLSGKMVLILSNLEFPKKSLIRGNLLGNSGSSWGTVLETPP